MRQNDCTNMSLSLHVVLVQIRVVCILNSFGQVPLQPFSIGRSFLLEQNETNDILSDNQQALNNKQNILITCTTPSLVESSTLKSDYFFVAVRVAQWLAIVVMFLVRSQAKPLWPNISLDQLTRALLRTGIKAIDREEWEVPFFFATTALKTFISTEESRLFHSIDL